MKKKKNKNQKQEELEQGLEASYQTLLQAHIDESDKAFDKKLFALSSGGLTLLFTMSTLNNRLSTNWALWCAAISYCSCLIINLVSHQIASQKSRNTIRNANNHEYQNESQDIVDRQNFLNDGLNWLCVLLFVIGVGFSFKYIQMQKTVLTYEEREGYSMPSPPSRPDPSKK